jgi:hypothetical protein
LWSRPQPASTHSLLLLPLLLLLLLLRLSPEVHLSIRFD